jgi:hypothetical protein
LAVWPKKALFSGSCGWHGTSITGAREAHGALQDFPNEEAVMKINKIITAALAVAFVGASALAVADPEVNQRLDNQNQRIDQGVASGELTHKEAKNLRKDDRKIHKEIKKDRAENGGKLTPKEKAKVNRQENHVSKKIYRKKHNDVKRPDAK